MRTARIPAPLLALALAACGSDPDVAASGWVDVPGMICADGTPTGIGISRGSADRVLVYLSGGGACWSEAACDADLRSFGRAEFDLGSLYVGGTILDRTLAGNPFATWTMVFIPYCTGDVHAGDSRQDYGTAGTWNHHGYRNLGAAVARMAAALAPPTQVVVAGSSAGGFGSLLAYDLVRAEWSAAAGTEGALVDDSGPTFVGTAIPEAIRTAWWASWNLSSTVGAHCPACEDGLDLSRIWAALRTRHGTDRFALVSTTEDATMRSFFGGIDGPSFEAALRELAAKLAADPDAAVFQIGGSTRHAPLFSPFTSFLVEAAADETPLLTWLSDMAAGSPSWTSKGP